MKQPNIIDMDMVSGCDRESGIYCSMYNRLRPFLEIMEEEQYKNLDDIDLSAFGLYLCKFIEQELNSSVMQLCRMYLGVHFPDCFCSVDPMLDRHEASVNTAPSYSKNPHWVFLNDCIDKQHPEVLKMIPLGDAMNVTKTLVSNDRRWFEQYPVLLNMRFMELWRDISRLRNIIAHPGSIINHAILLECYDKSVTFIKSFLQDLVKIKESLAPEDWEGMKPIDYIAIGEKSTGTSSVEELMSQFENTGKQKATAENYGYHKRLDALLKKSFGSEMEYEIGQELSDYDNQYDWFDVLFEENGKIGSKDITGEVVVPAKYDDIFELHSKICVVSHSIIVKKDGKLGLVEMYTGKELCPIEYDSFYPIELPDFMYFRKNGTDCYGLMNRNSGKEVIPCIIDANYPTIDTIQNFIFRSGDKYGIYSRYHDVYLEPVFDEIRVSEEDYEPFIYSYGFSK